MNIEKIQKTTIAYSTTVWEEQQSDGIGTYTKELHHALVKLAEYNLMLAGFGKELPHFSNYIVQLICLNKRLVFPSARGLPALFHATDHYIPAFNNVPVIATVMDIIPFIHPEWTSGKGRKLKNALFKKMILSADHLITISEYSKQEIVNYFGFLPERISVTHLGVNALYFSMLSSEEKKAVLDKYGLEPGFFLFIGTLQPRKNLERLLAAHARLSESNQRKHPLVIIGRVGWNVSLALKQIKQGEKTGTVKWLHYLPQYEIRSLLQSAQALTFLSLYEGFGLPIIEAFAAGCPVVTSNVTSLPETAGNAAYLVDPYDVAQIQTAMVDLIEDQVLLDTLKEKGRTRAKSFTWEACALKTAQVYQQFLIQHVKS